jgi:hypothetical protein
MISKKFFVIAAMLMIVPALIYTVRTESKELSPESQTAVPKYALLVGINEYKSQTSATRSSTPT